MRKSVPLLVLLISVAVALRGQQMKTIYFDSQWNVVENEDECTYYRKVSVDSRGNPVGEVRTFYRSTGELQWTGQFRSRNLKCIDCEKCKCEGLCAWYDETGKRTHEAYYQNGRLLNARELSPKTSQPLDIESELLKSMASERVFKQLLDYNITAHNYDPLQGIWEVESTLQVFLDRQLMNTQLSQSQIGIIKLKGKYQSFVINKAPSQLQFSETDTPNTYRISWFDGTSSHFGTARLTGMNSMGAVIKINHTFVRKALGLTSVEGVEAFKELVFSRVYPSMDRINELRREGIKKGPQSGTCFALSGNGYVATSYHIVKNAKSIKIRGVNGDFSRRYIATLISKDDENDIAILKINDPSFTGLAVPYDIKTANSDVGEDVFTLGYPLTTTMGDEVKLATGVISARTGSLGSVSQYQITAPVQPGNSGGPLFDKAGNVVGIVSSKHIQTDNVAYAIKASFLQNVIDLLPEPIGSSIAKVSQRTLPEQVKIFRNFVYIVEVNMD